MPASSYRQAPAKTLLLPLFSFAPPVSFLLAGTGQDAPPPTVLVPTPTFLFSCRHRQDRSSHLGSPLPRLVSFVTPGLCFLAGTGKTLIARACAAQTNACFLGQFRDMSETCPRHVAIGADQRLLPQARGCLEAEYLPVSPHISPYLVPISGIRVLVSQPALERATYSAVFRCIHCLRLRCTHAVL